MTMKCMVFTAVGVEDVNFMTAALKFVAPSVDIVDNAVDGWMVAVGEVGYSH